MQQATMHSGWWPLLGTLNFDDGMALPGSVCKALFLNANLGTVYASHSEQFTFITYLIQGSTMSTIRGITWRYDCIDFCTGASQRR